jgi:hypothetical protein
LNISLNNVSESSFDSFTLFFCSIRDYKISSDILQLDNGFLGEMVRNSDRNLLLSGLSEVVMEIGTLGMVLSEVVLKTATLRVYFTKIMSTCNKKNEI